MRWGCSGFIGAGEMADPVADLFIAYHSWRGGAMDLDTYHGVFYEILNRFDDPQWDEWHQRQGAWIDVRRRMNDSLSAPVHAVQ